MLTLHGSDVGALYIVIEFLDLLLQFIKGDELVLCIQFRKETDEGNQLPQIKQ